MEKVKAFLSWRNWGILRYNSIWQNLAALFYLALVEDLSSLGFLGWVGLFIAFSTLMTAFGYLVNDFADRDLDLRQGKANAFSGVAGSTAVLVVIAVLLAGIGLGWPFLRNPAFAGLWLLWVGSALIYSLPPVRLKERGLPGLVVTVAAQQTLPTAMLFALFGQLFSPAGLIFITYATLRGISSDVSHQMREREADAASGSRTFAVAFGPSRTRLTYAFALEAERLALGAVFLLMLAHLPHFSLPGLETPLPTGLPLFLFYLPLLVLTVGSSLRAFRQGRLAEEDPYDEQRQLRQRDLLHVIHHTLPTVLAPLYLGLWLALEYWPNLLFLLVLTLLYGLYSPRRWAATWPIRPLLEYRRTLIRSLRRS